MVGVHTFIAHSGDNWQTLTNVMEKKGTMAAHTLELPSPDVRRWNLQQTVPVSFMPGYNYNDDEKINWTDKFLCNKLNQLKSIKIAR